MPIPRTLLPALAAAALLAPAAPLRAQPPQAPPARGVAGEVRAGVPVTGQLLRSDSALDDRTHVDVWTYRGRRGERLTVTLASAEFDAYLMVERPVGGEVLAQDDDGGSNTNSRVVVDLLADGDYHLLANTVHAGETGRYTLTVRSDTVASAATGIFLASHTNRPARDWAARYPGGGDPRERYALLVGISSYPGKSEDLEGPADDVRVMRDLLVERYGFPAANVLTLREGEGNREQILNAALRHLGQAGPEGVAVFYYSGHGMQLDGDFGAADEPDGKDEALLVLGPGSTTTTILDDELAYLSERLGAGRALFVLDACHSGGAAGASGRPVPPSGGEAALSGTLASPGAPRRRVLMAASSSGESSYVAATRWMNGGKESVFTHYLVDHLRRTPRATFGTVQTEVGRLTAEYSRNRFKSAQRPQVEGADAAQAVEAFLGKR